VFNPAIIETLRKRVAAHNEIVAGHPDHQVKLTRVKKLYKRWHSGPNPAGHALAMIDGRLLTLQTQALGTLAKAREPFDPGRHPRGRGGRFSGGGGDDGDGGQPPAPVPSDDPLLQAAQTQIIPETRYSVIWPKILGAAGLAVGAGVGAVADTRLPGQGGGSVPDRIATHVLERVGRGGGKLSGRVAALLAVRLPIRMARGVIGRINRDYSMAIPRPRAGTEVRYRAAIRDVGGKVGAWTGRTLGNTMSYQSLPAGYTRRLAEFESNGSPIAGHIAGGIVGMAVPGLPIAMRLHDWQEEAGPYMDTAFPRRVQKAVDDLWNAPEVLAKQAELLALAGVPELRKSDGALDLDQLEKAIGTQALRGLFSVIRRPPSISGMFRRPAAAAAAAAGGPDTGAYHAAAGAFGRVRPHVAVPNNRLARALYMAGHGVAIAGAGAGVGALTGAGLAAFASEHPRDPHTGQFRTKGQAAIAGAKRGALIGAGIGLTGGAIAATQAQRRLLREAIERLRGRATTKVTTDGVTKDVNLHQQAHEEAQAAARTAYAHQFHDEHRLGRQRIPAAAANVTGEDHIKHIGAELQRHAVETFMAEKGTAMQAGAKVWYRHQLEAGFEAAVRRAFGELPKGQRSIPRKTKFGTLFDAIDKRKLKPNQRKLWNSLVITRRKGLKDIEDVYRGRSREVQRHGATLGREMREHAHLTEVLPTISHDWAALKNSEPTLEQIREFAKTTMGHTVRSQSVETAIEEVDHRIPTWLEGATVRHTALGTQIEQDKAAYNALKAAADQGFDPQEAQTIENPFSTNKKNRMFEPLIGDIPGHLQRLREAAVKPFHDALAAEVAAAHGHLGEMIDATEASLQARATDPGVIERMAPKIMAAMAGRMKQAAIDTANLARAHRDSLSGTMRDIYDQVYVHTNPTNAWASAKKMAMNAADYGEKIGDWVRRNHKMIWGLIGIGTAVGVIDMTAPRGKRLNMPRRPKDMDVVFEVPDPIKRPGEALYGLSYRDTKNREKFLWGTHIRNREGTDYADIPPGAEVERIKGSLRNFSGSGGGKINVQDEAVVRKAMAAVGAKLKKGGPPGFEFEHRDPNQTDGDANRAGQEITNALNRTHIRENLRNVKGDEAHPDADPFWHSLAQIFTGEGSGLMTLRQRAGLLFGFQDVKANQLRRGILPNASAYQGSDATKVVPEIRKLINIGRLAPRNAEEYGNMRRLIWMSGQRGVGGNVQNSLVQDLNRVWTRAHHSNPPTEVSAATTPPPGAAASHQARFETEFVNILDSMPQEDRPLMWHDERDFHDELSQMYMSERTRSHAAGQDDNTAHRHAMEVINEALDRYRTVEQAEPLGDLYKMFGLTKLLPDHHRQRMGLPPISGASSEQRLAQPQPASPGPMQPEEFAHQRPPESPGMAPTQPSRPSGTAHVLGQVGSYGLSQAGYDAVRHLTAHFMPSGGMVSRAMKIGLNTIGGGVGGGALGEAGGHAIGRAMGDYSPQQRPDDTGTMVGQTTGTLAQVGFNMAAPRIGRSAVGQAMRRGVTGTVARVLGGAVGTMADPWIGPSGTLIGATLAGALADEGADILYRHLHHYGEHVPQHALKTLGHQRQSAT
jgi:hypothetical protein